VRKSGKKFLAEVTERAVRTVAEQPGEHASPWAVKVSNACKIGCSPETLRSRMRQAERDAAARAGLTSDERARLKALERENRELRQANEILH
jgi:transposase